MLMSVRVEHMAVVNTAITPLTPTHAAVVVVTFLELMGGHALVNITILLHVAIYYYFLCIMITIR